MTHPLKYNQKARWSRVNDIEANNLIWICLLFQKVTSSRPSPTSSQKQAERFLCTGISSSDYWKGLMRCRLATGSTLTTTIPQYTCSTTWQHDSTPTVVAPCVQTASTYLRKLPTQRQCLHWKPEVRIMFCFSYITMDRANMKRLSSISNCLYMVWMKSIGQTKMFLLLDV